MVHFEWIFNVSCNIGMKHVLLLLWGLLKRFLLAVDNG